MARTARTLSREDLPHIQPLWRDYLAELRVYDPSIDIELPFDPTWFDKPGMLEPLAIEAEGEGEVVGFLMLTGRAYAEALGEDADHHVYELYIAPEHRGTGLARRFVRAAIAERPGQWTLSRFAEDPRTTRFWDGLLAEWSPEVRRISDLRVGYRFAVP